MSRIMVLSFLLFVITSLNAQPVLNETSFSGVYQGKPLFIQNPYLSTEKAYCIKKITVNKRTASLNYEMSALILDFQGVDKFSPVSIHIEYADSTCVPVLLNPEAIRYHSVFTFVRLEITDSSLVWQTKGESQDGIYEIQTFNLGYWESANLRDANGDYGNAEYVYFPLFEEGANKFRIKYSSSTASLYSDEIEHVFYPEPITFKRDGSNLVLSRSCAYVVSDYESTKVMSGSGKEIDISELKSGEYYITFNDAQSELFRKNDRVKVYKKIKQNN